MRALLILSLAWGWCGWIHAAVEETRARRAESRVAEAEAWSDTVADEAGQWMGRIRGGAP